jgi:LmbE family N-acetylglucosaminyl deacetylase
MEIWASQKKILGIFAHPDDPEFFCGATIAQWIQKGHNVEYCLLTKGEKGINDTFNDTENIISIREKEQKAAAAILGIKNIYYLDYEDGMLAPNMNARKDVVRVIRLIKPDIVVTCDPTNYYLNDRYINHPDHRAAGQIVIDAVFPAAQNELYFPELINENIFPHHVEEVWLSLPKDPNVTFDVTETWPIKIKALEEHITQIGDIQKFRERMASRGAYSDKNGVLHFEEKFNRIDFSKS